VTSVASSDFWKAFDALPAHVQEAAQKQYALWRANPAHPSLQFKQLRPGLWSVRVTRAYRALGLREGDVITWIWIGTHAEYDRLIR
jgi:hypothetical protein